jgi:hypothetical protein
MPEKVNHKFVLSHQGEINYDNIGVLLTKLKKKMEEHGFKLGLYKKVLAVMVECLENIYKYLDSVRIDESAVKENQPYFNLEFFDDHFLLTAGNPLLSSDVERLHKKLNEINDLDGFGLKEMYKKIITDGQFTEKGGAGLGFIEMVKTTGNKIGFVFDEVSNDVSYFHITLKIPAK